MTTVASTEFIHPVESAEQVFVAARELRNVLAFDALTLREILDAFESWSEALNTRSIDDIPGVVFLRTWLRRGTIEPIIARELGPAALNGEWMESGRARCRVFPLGLIGHWPAGNVEIQPILSMTCALLGGNAALVRVPASLVETTQRLMEPLSGCDAGERLLRRIFLAAFHHERQDMHEAMAKTVDGAMIWGGRDAVMQVRALPFPPWARFSVFGPRISIAAMDSGAWDNPAAQFSWCRRIARDVWQFEQHACTSPQALFLENPGRKSIGAFIQNLRHAFETENHAHSRRTIAVSLTSRIVHARAKWLLDDPTRAAIFPANLDWSLLLGQGSEIPEPVQGKTLPVLEVGDINDVLSKCDGNVQTVGLGIADAQREKDLAFLAGKRGVDRIVKLGRMHAFGSPWDGIDLIRPMVRLVRHVPSSN